MVVAASSSSAASHQQQPPAATGSGSQPSVANDSAGDAAAESTTPPSSPATAAPTMRLVVNAERSAQRPSPVSTIVHALAELTVEARPTDARRPMSLAFVLDFSGSMSGDKERRLKNAVSVALDAVKDTDSVTIIAYNHDVEVLAVTTPGAERQQLKAAVMKHWSDGTTNISKALEAAAAVLATSPPTHLRRIFLYSDGCPNAGLEEPADFSALAKRLRDASGIITWTFGIGEDVSAPVMEALAEGGQGHYDFVTPRRLQELTRRAMQSFEGLIGSDAALVIRCPQQYELVQAADDDVAEPSSVDAADCTSTYRVEIGDLRSNLKQVLLAFRAPPASDGACGSIQCALVYTPASGDGTGEAVVVRDTVTVTTGLAIEFKASGDVDTNQRVATARALANVRSVFAQVAVLIDRNDKTRAASLMREALTSLEAHEEHDDTGFVETQLRRGRRTLERLTAGESSRRVGMEISHQRAALGHLSEADFDASESGAHTPVLLSPRGNRHGFMSDDDDDDDDGGSGGGSSTSSVSSDDSWVNRGDWGEPPRSNRQPRAGTPVPRRSGSRDAPDFGMRVMDAMFGLMPATAAVPAPAQGGSSRPAWLNNRGTADSPASPDDEPADDTAMAAAVNAALQLSMGAGARDPTRDAAPASPQAPPPPITLPAALANADGDTIAAFPPEFICPLTQQVMDDPVITMDGQTYQRSAIEEWFRTGSRQSPLTRIDLPSTILTPNFALRSMIAAYNHPPPSGGNDADTSAPSP